MREPKYKIGGRYPMLFTINNKKDSNRPAVLHNNIGLHWEPNSKIYMGEIIGIQIDIDGRNIQDILYHFSFNDIDKNFSHYCIKEEDISETKRELLESLRQKEIDKLNSIYEKEFDKINEE